MNAKEKAAWVQAYEESLSEPAAVSRWGEVWQQVRDAVLALLIVIVLTHQAWLGFLVIWLLDR